MTSATNTGKRTAKCPIRGRCEVCDVGKPDESDEGISRCHFLGWHVYAAGPCFGTREQAVKYRAELDDEGITWKPQR